MCGLFWTGLIFGTDVLTPGLLVYVKADCVRSLGTMCVCNVADHPVYGLILQIGVPLRFTSSIGLVLEYYEVVRDVIEIPVYKLALHWQLASPGELGDVSRPFFAELDGETPAFAFTLKNIQRRKKQKSVQPGSRKRQLQNLHSLRHRGQGLTTTTETTETAALEMLTTTCLTDALTKMSSMRHTRR